MDINWQIDEYIIRLIGKTSYGNKDIDRFIYRYLDRLIEA